MAIHRTKTFASMLLATLLSAACESEPDDLSGSSGSSGSFASASESSSGSTTQASDAGPRADGAGTKGDAGPNNRDSGSNSVNDGGVLAASRLVPARASGYSINSPEHKRLYGPGVLLCDNLWNIDLGGPSSTSVSVRFRAPRSTAVPSIRTHFVANTSSRRGYSAGSGGRIRARVFLDDNTSKHAPMTQAAPIATAYFQPALDANAIHVNKADTWPTLTFESQLLLTQDALYHIVFDNVHPNPAANFLGFNTGVQVREHGSPGRWTSPIDWAVLSKQGGAAWEDDTVTQAYSDYLAPSVQFNALDGSVFGNMPFEPGNYEYQALILSNTRTGSQSSSLAVERFVPSANKTVTGISLLAASTVAGSLEWRIVSGGSALASGMFTDASATYKPNTRTSGGPYGTFTWYDAEIPSDLSMNAGQSYDVEFRAVGSSEWRLADQRNGSDYGFKYPAAFSESEALYRYNGALIRHYHWSYGTDSGGANWRVVLHTK
jgi:hypothetical protein